MTIVNNINNIINNLDLLKKHDEIIKLISEKKKKPELITLNNYYYNDLRKSVNKKKYLTLEELSNIMRYKLMLGKMRPLQKKVDGNDPEKVINTTKEAFLLLKENNLIEGLKKLIDNLDGIGIATASYIGALVRPDIYPIMYDEVIIELTGPKIKYDLKTYIKIQEKIMEIANNINNLNNLNKLNKLNKKQIITAKEISLIIWIKNIMIKYS
jgi:hypothetical protein